MTNIIKRNENKNNQSFYQLLRWLISISHFDGTAYILHVALEHEPILFHHLKHHVVLKVLDKVQHPLPQSEGRQVPLR